MYATAAELDDYVEGTAYEGRFGDAARKDRILELAERDLDQEAFLLDAPNATTIAAPKLVPTELDREPREGLKRATCAQAVYRLEMGDEHFVRAQRERVTGRGFSAEGKLPIVGPQAWRELSAVGLPRLSTSTAGGGDDRRFQSE